MCFAFYMAGLQVTINGRIGVTAEVSGPPPRPGRMLRPMIPDLTRSILVNTAPPSSNLKTELSRAGDRLPIALGWETPYLRMCFQSFRTYRRQTGH